MMIHCLHGRLLASESHRALLDIETCGNESSYWNVVGLINSILIGARNKMIRLTKSNTAIRKALIKILNARAAEVKAAINAAEFSNDRVIALKHVRALSPALSLREALDIVSNGKEAPRIDGEIL